MRSCAAHPSLRALYNMILIWLIAVPQEPTVNIFMRYRTRILESRNTNGLEESFPC